MRAGNLLLMVVNEAMDQLAMANSICWYSHVLRRVDGYVLRREIVFEADGRRNKVRLKRTWKKKV